MDKPNDLISTRDLRAIAFNTLLSSIEVAAINVKGRHWLVAGPGFDSAHTLLDKVWKTLLDGADKVAETLRVLGKIPDWDSETWVRASYIDLDKSISSVESLDNVNDFLRATRDELNKVIANIHDLIEKGYVDPTFESDLTAFTSELRHHILFLDGTIKDWEYAE